MRQIKNRIETSLDILEIRVDHADGSFRTDPNGAVGCAIWAMSGEKPSWQPGMLGDKSQLFNPLELKPKPGLTSILSGGPAVMYRSDDVEVPLTPEELFRLLKRSLRPEEALQLLDHFGEFHEIHDDFYDPATGEAFQPMDDGPEPAYRA